MTPDEPQATGTNNATPMPVRAKWPMRFSLSHSSEAFTAEYSIMLVALTFGLSNLVWLVYAFFNLVAASMHGGADSLFSSSTPILVLWLAVLSAVMLPVAAIFWSRTQGELANNEEFKGVLPKGGARGFRTFWLVASGLSAMLMVAAAIFVPLMAAVEASSVGEALVGATVPGLLGAGIVVAGICLVTLPVHKRKMARLMLWAVALLTAVLVATDYLWASNMHGVSEPTYPYGPTVPIPADPNYPDYNYHSPVLY